LANSEKKTQKMPERGVLKRNPPRTKAPGKEHHAADGEKKKETLQKQEKKREPTPQKTGSGFRCWKKKTFREEKESF